MSGELNLWLNGDQIQRFNGNKFGRDDDYSGYEKHAFTKLQHDMQQQSHIESDPQEINDDELPLSLSTDEFEVWPKGKFNTIFNICPQVSA